ncbi:MAG: hypothetical protein AAF726_14535 [Planctomycetota bacterium]
MTYAIARRDWSAQALLAPVTSQDIRCTPDEAREHEPRIWTDLVAEYDARLLQAELLGRATAFSPEFLRFLDAWAEDEEHHSNGLLRLYSLVTREPEDAVRERLAERRGDFSAMDSWLDDEFLLLVLFAYDEAMSTHGYGEDIPFYASLGPPAFETLLREMKNDEALHYANAMRVLAANHAHRAADVAGAMDRIVAFDADQDEYRATFVLDHATSQFSAEQMEKVGASVRAALERRMRTAAPSVQS